MIKSIWEQTGLSTPKVPQQKKLDPRDALGGNPEYNYDEAAQAVAVTEANNIIREAAQQSTSSMESRGSVVINKIGEVGKVIEVEKVVEITGNILGAAGEGAKEVGSGAVNLVVEGFLGIGASKNSENITPEQAKQAKQNQKLQEDQDYAYQLKQAQENAKHQTQMSRALMGTEEYRLTEKDLKAINLNYSLEGLEAAQLDKPIYKVLAREAKIKAQREAEEAEKRAKDQSMQASSSKGNSLKFNTDAKEGNNTIGTAISSAG